MELACASGFQFLMVTIDWIMVFGPASSKVCVWGVLILWQRSSVEGFCPAAAVWQCLHSPGCHNLRVLQTSSGLRLGILLDIQQFMGPPQRMIQNQMAVVLRLETLA